MTTPTISLPPEVKDAYRRRLSADPTPVDLFRRLGLEPDPWQRQVLEARKRFNLLNIARQLGKSTIAAAKATHVAAYEPETLTLIVSPSLRQSSETHLKFRSNIEQLGTQMREDNKLSTILANGSRVVSLPGTHETIRGYSRPRLVILDEASQISEELFAALIPMLNTGNGEFWEMSTPYGKRGTFYRHWSENNEWNKLMVTALECSRISPEQIEFAKANMTDGQFRQEFMCEFVETDDQAFGEAYIQAAIRDDVPGIDL